MSESTKINEEIVKQATVKILPKGYKPEDYLKNGDGIPLRLAILIVQEASHIVQMEENYSQAMEQYGEAEVLEAIQRIKMRRLK